MGMQSNLPQSWTVVIHPPKLFTLAATSVPFAGFFAFGALYFLPSPAADPAIPVMKASSHCYSLSTGSCQMTCFCRSLLNHVLAATHISGVLGYSVFIASPDM